MASREELSERFKNYHLGCGPVFYDDFLNVDGEFPNMDLEFGVPRRYDANPKQYLLLHDLRNGVPAADNSLHVIYHCHFLEHLDDQDGRRLISECYRSLRPGGVMRFAVPDLNLWCTNYLSDRSEFFDWYRATYLANDKERYKTKASVFMGMLYNWGHRISYDFETISTVLHDAGFRQVSRMQWGSSTRVANIQTLESHSNLRRIESLVIECLKGSL